VSDRYDVIVVGAGPGGATCAAILAKSGLKVLLLDKNSQAGGKTMTVSRNGFRYEFWPICASPAGGFQFQAVLKKLGLENEMQVFIPDPLALAHYREPSGKVRTMVMPGPSGLLEPDKMLQDLIAFLGVTDTDMPEVLRLMTDMMTMGPHDLGLLDDVTVKDFLDRYQIPRSAYSFLATIRCEATMEVPVDAGCASEFVKIVQDSARGGGGFYVAGGLGTLCEAMARVVKANGSDVLLKTRVEQISLQNGRVTGVFTEKGAFHAPIVVSSAGILPTVLKLVGEEHFERSYVDYVKDLVPDWGFAGVRYFLNKPILKYPVYLYFSDNTILTLNDLRKQEAGQIPDDFYVYMGTNSLFPGMAPEGKQFAWVGLTCPADPKTKMKPIFDALEAAVSKLWPEVTEHIESKEYYGPAQVSALTRDSVMPGQGGECFGLAPVVGQCGKHKPSPKSPIRGLYYVGFDAGSYGIGVHQSVDSGIKVAEMVRQYSLAHRI